MGECASYCPQNEPLIEMVKVHLWRGGARVLHDVNLRIDKGENIAIIGPNGSGKSSLIKVMMGDLRHDTSVNGAAVRILGKERWNLFDVRRAFGLVSPDLQMELNRDMIGLEAVASGAFGYIGINRSCKIDDELLGKVRDSMREIGALHLANRRLSAMSSGEARRVLLARALVNRPEALILDEPMTSLDLIGKAMVSRSMRSAARAGKGIILVTHDPCEIIPEIERVIMLKQGRIFMDIGIDQMDERNLSSLYGVPVRLRRVEGRYVAWS